jgi:hypothetical protein
MFTSSRPFLPFDHLRVPYRVDPAIPGASPAGLPGRWASLAATGAASPALFWPGERAAPPRRFRIGDSWFHGSLVPDAHLAPALAAAGAGWRRAEPLTEAAGGRAGSIWTADDGSLLLPFDPSELLAAFWGERYSEPGAEGTGGAGSRLRGAAMSAYYTVRPVLPRRLQIAARRLYSRLQGRTPFPRWPVEPSLDDLLDRVLGWVTVLAGRPVPWIAPWPDGHRWAFVLTHDVETEEGLRRMRLLRAVEERTGSHSSWNFVPGRYPVPHELVAELQACGNEVGLHGLEHDGRDLEPGHFERRLPEMRRHAERWGAVGFRSPATHRSWDAMARLPFAYDSSFPDTDPYEPQPGGCCSLLPFFVGDVVELPITLPQDHTLFVILRAQDARTWLDKVAWIRERGGLAVVLTHPDYVDAAPALPAYEELLTSVGADPDVWRPLPKEVAAWWRRRAATEVVPDGDGWSLTGPAAREAAIRLTSPAQASPDARPVRLGGG